VFVQSARTSSIGFSRCYTNLVPEEITITLDPAVAAWVRHKAVDDHTSVSELISRLIEKEKRAAYWRAYEEWKRLLHDLGGSIDASQRFTRDEAHERR
jgi:hypothetical protein